MGRSLQLPLSLSNKLPYSIYIYKYKASGALCQYRMIMYALTDRSRSYPLSHLYDRLKAFCRVVDETFIQVGGPFLEQ